jgi:beta-phosphoglucomutase
MSKKKAILFDLDGTLVDTPPYHYRAWKKVLSDLGGAITEQNVNLNEGRNSLGLLQELVKETGIALPAVEFENIIRRKRDYYQQIVQVRFYPGVIELLKELEIKEFILAIVSSCSKETMLRSLNSEIRSLFSYIQTGDDTTESKPDPEPYSHAIRELCLEPDECIVIENAPLGILSAKRAGLECIAVSSTLNRNFLSKADCIISDIKEISTTRFLK